MSPINNRKPTAGRKVQLVNSESPRVLIGVRHKFYLNGLAVAKIFVPTGAKVPKVTNDRHIKKNVYRYKQVRVINKIIHQ